MYPVCTTYNRGLEDKLNGMIYFCWVVNSVQVLLVHRLPEFRRKLMSRKSEDLCLNCQGGG
jgi:hypothetical protein